MNIPQRDFGGNGISVSALGFGAGRVGDPSQEEKQVETLLNEALDMGVTLFDTARGYGMSEKRIGKYLAHRRQDIILSTKVGYSIPGYPDWTYDCVIAGVDTALDMLKTDYIDIVHLHTCPAATLRDAGVVDALAETVQAGKVRVMAYSGENEDLWGTI